MTEPYTPTTDEIRTCATDYEYKIKADAFDRWLSATLATVRPNPDDAAQVETVARALCAAEYDPDDVGPDDYLPDEVYDVASPAELEFYQNSARAVLTALAVRAVREALPLADLAYLLGRIEALEGENARLRNRPMTLGHRAAVAANVEALRGLDEQRGIIVRLTAERDRYKAVAVAARAILDDIRAGEPTPPADVDALEATLAALDGA